MYNIYMVSVIMPTYNCGAFIGEAIKSVKMQTYQVWELIVVDDCSTDNTESVVRQIMADDARLIYIRNDKQLGAAESRNKALRKAKGHWVAFLDSDDMWLPAKLEKQIAFMDGNNYHFSYHAYSSIDENGNALGIIVGGIAKVGKASMYSCCWPGCLTVMYDRDYVGLVQVANLRKNNDTAMWLKVVEKCPCYFLDENLAVYRHRKGSITPTSTWRKIIAHYPLFRRGASMSPLAAGIMVVVNIFGNAYKKMMFVKSDNNDK